MSHTKTIIQFCLSLFFQDGKDNIIGGFALQTASNANILTYLSIIGFYNFPLDYLDTKNMIA
jgi:hypothetical protein